jgi:hypothetical protein
VATAAPAAPTPTVVTPSVSLSVLFYPDANDMASGFVVGTGYAAVIASVLGNGNLNLSVLNGDAGRVAMLNVPFVQPGATAPIGGYYASALPYQDLAVPTVT